MQVHCLLQKSTSCCITWDMRMLHIKMFISNAVQEIKQTNNNGQFAGCVQIKPPWIPEAPGCSLVVAHITCRSQLLTAISSGAKTLCCKNGGHLSIFDWNIPESGYWLLTGCIKQLYASRNQRSRFSVFLGASGI